MPERQIPWHHAAAQLRGTVRADTRTASTLVTLSADVDGCRVEVVGKSVPYRPLFNWTEISTIAPSSAGFRLRVSRERGSWLKWLGGRDVAVGEPGFDDRWIIRTSKEPMAQAWLGPAIRQAIDALPHEVVSMPDSAVARWYDFELAGRRVRARIGHFEHDSARLVAAVRAVTAIANRESALVRAWEQVAGQLEGQASAVARWRPDGSVRVVVALRGARVVVAPAVVSGGWRRRRLATRVHCDRADDRADLYAIGPADSLVKPRGHQRVVSLEAKLPSGFRVYSLVPDAVAARMTTAVCDAIAAAAPVAVSGDRTVIAADLPGHVTAVERIRAAAAAAVLLAGADQRAGPYR